MIPVDTISDVQFGASNVTVTLEWFQNEVVFSSVYPPASVRSVGNRSVQLIIPYNTKHNVSIAICGQPSPEVIKLYYSKQNDILGTTCNYFIFSNSD